MEVTEEKVSTTSPKRNRHRGFEKWKPTLAEGVDPLNHKKCMLTKVMQLLAPSEPRIDHS
jgi:hypothetical protein